MSADIRVGDLVKATNKDRPENYAVFRVVAADSHWVENAINSFQVKSHTFEVLDRPLPPISDELLSGAIDTYRKGRGWYNGPASKFDMETYAEGITPVINFVRKYDAEHNNKESK